jgi:hypothetical protein
LRDSTAFELVAQSLTSMGFRILPSCQNTASSLSSFRPKTQKFAGDSGADHNSAVRHPQAKQSKSGNLFCTLKKLKLRIQITQSIRLLFRHLDMLEVLLEVLLQLDGFRFARTQLFRELRKSARKLSVCGVPPRRRGISLLRLIFEKARFVRLMRLNQAYKRTEYAHNRTKFPF